MSPPWARRPSALSRIMCVNAFFVTFLRNFARDPETPAYVDTRQ
jgi:hypothetical protein